ncbi:MAG: CHAD domain-containing protein [Pirellulales bacterium]|nr:CHAD domain-containing protein [Pirellulales bacterium]
MTNEDRGKWFRDISPQQPASEVARKTLAKRLDVVRHYLPLAAMEYEKDIEHVHQLRVGCRRAMAAVTAWKAILPAKPARRVKRMLRKIRRSADDARDHDVLFERFQNSQDIPHEGFNALIDQITQQRQEGQAPIIAMHKKIGRNKFARRVASLMDSIPWQSSEPEPTYAEFAQIRMAAIASEFFDVASGNGGSAKDLHSLRIAGKRLRYAMEIFADAFGNEFREILYPVVEQLQDKLGALNDHNVAQKRFQRIVATIPPNAVAAYLAGLIQEEWAEFTRGRDEFLAWWTTDRIRDLQAGLDQVICKQRSMEVI